jgi:hypothetical protein
MNRLTLVVLVALGGCAVADANAPVDASAPTNLTFQLQPSGDPSTPDGVILTWNPPSDGLALTYTVFGRSNNTGWTLRATTTSPSFHDEGIPQTQYYVVAQNEQGQDMGTSNTVIIDLTARLQAPASLTSTSLNGAIQLAWSDNAVVAGGSAFDHYRVYSSDYDLASGQCVAPWFFEGSTVSDAFIAGNLTNGVTRCYAVSAISIDGHESLWSNVRSDTPRLDAKNVLVYVAGARSDSAAFLFTDATTGRSGVVGTTARTDADFTVSRQADGTVWLTPARTGSAVTTYSTTSVADLTAIDRAPVAGFQTAAVQAQPGFGYVFKLTENDGTHFAAMRVAYVTSDFIVFDWAYQPAVGNPELSMRRSSP